MLSREHMFFRTLHRVVAGVMVPSCSRISH
jgi:hypothetical protein